VGLGNFFFLGFVLWWVFFSFSFFPLHFYQAQNVFFITKNIVITHKLSTIEGFYHKMNNFVMVLVFLIFFHNPNEIAKKKEKKEIKECVVGVNMWLVINQSYVF
jgi:hypothetical protein